MKRHLFRFLHYPNFLPSNCLHYIINTMVEKYFLHFKCRGFILHLDNRKNSYNKSEYFFTGILT
jgi:hypothetical protein